MSNAFIKKIANTKLAIEISMHGKLLRHFNKLGADLGREYELHTSSGVEKTIRDAQIRVRALIETVNSKTASRIGLLQYNALVPKKCSEFELKQIEEELLAGMRVFIQDSALKSSLLIEQTDRNTAQEIITSSIQSGLSNSQVAQRLKDAFSVISITGRAAMIARTEVGIASSESQYRSAKATNLDLVKEWISVSDDRTRDNHRLINGSVVAMNDVFVVGSDKLKFPRDSNASAGNVINCRCEVFYKSKAFL